MTAALAVVCAAFDWRRRRVPPLLPVLGALSLLTARGALEGVGGLEEGLVSGLVSGLLGGLACAAPFALLALSSKVGWGDVGLLAAVGAGLGIPRALTALMLISVVGAGLAVTFVVGRRRASASVTPAPGARVGVDSARAIPYGVPIAVGAVWAMAWAGPAVPDDGSGEAPVQIEVVDGGVQDE